MSRPWRTHRLSRRLFLGGIGSLFALPLLESSLPRRLRASGTARAAAIEAPPKRMLFYFVPNGINMPDWTPGTTGTAWADSPILTPLAERGVKGDTLVLSGLDNEPGRPTGNGDHAGGTGAFLTCHTVKKSSSDFENTVSVDQVAAATLRGTTAFPSLQLGLKASAIGGCDVGYNTAYTRNISWSGPKSPMPKVSLPRVLFELMFSGVDPTISLDDLERQRSFRVSVLDFVNDDAKRLRGNLGTSDRFKLDEYLQGISELELRVKASDLALIEPIPGADWLDEGHQTHSALFNDLMVRAFQTDTTRVISFMGDVGLSARAYPFLDVYDAHHSLSHHNGEAANLAKLTKVNRWAVGQFASLVEKLKAIPEEDGSTLLDHCTLYFSSDVADGDTHTHHDLPILVAGGGAGFEMGRHLDLDGGRVSELFLSMLRGVGVEAESFGDDGFQELAGLS